MKMALQQNKSGNARQLNRKQIRKNQRKDKKSRKNEWFANKGKSKHKPEENAQEEAGQDFEEVSGHNKKHNKPQSDKPKLGTKVLSTEEQHARDKKQKKKLETEMQKQRKKQLLEANEKEDKTIRKLEKQLKLHKRKTKSIPKSFASDGLDFLLEVCDPEYLSNAVHAEQDLSQVNNDFEEDLALITGKDLKSKKSKKKMKEQNFVAESSDLEGGTDDFGDMEDFLNEDDSSNDETQSFESDDNGSDFSDIESSRVNNEKYKKRKITNENSDTESKNSTKAKTMKRMSTEENNNSKKKKTQNNKDDDLSEEDFSDLEEGNTEENDLERKEFWEDIYGRLRGKDGSIILNNKEEKYIPPAIRAKMATTEDKKRTEKLLRLKRQLKGLLNRLAESNMHSIASQIEGLYMNNSRNDMNETLTELITDSLVSNVAAPERLLMEHILLIAVLHANVGTEVGAHFLQTMVKSFDDLTQTDQDISNKRLDNIVNILAQLYNFKVFEAKLLYEILSKLSEKFDEKNIDCILHVLKNVGFGLRKDDPVALKNLILELQKQAASASEGKVANSRVKFLLDILMAIKNNNMTKIPNYDPTYSEHLKKIMKGFIRKGNYVTQLNISLEDLLKAGERGKWWVVGSAWTGKTDPNEKKEKTSKTADNFSQKLLDLAKKQRMNTDTRRDIFCIIMSAEDYIDAFEKLLKLGLKNQQEREIVHVILHCCLQEKVYNPYYAVLAQKFCEYDRKFQMTIKYSAWDKLKALSEHSGNQISNLAKLLTHLFIEKGLPISTLKIVEFGELDKITLRFIRQILLGILLHDDLEQIQEIFLKIAHSEKLKMFRESLRLFIHHFVLRNLKTEVVSEENKTKIEERAANIEKILSVKDSRLRL